MDNNGSFNNQGFSENNGTPVYEPGIMPGYEAPAGQNTPNNGQPMSGYNGQPMGYNGLQMPGYNGPVQQNAYRQPLPPINNINPVQNPDGYAYEDRKKANLLCIISLVCMFGTPILDYILTGTANIILDTANDASAVKTTVLGGFTSLSFIAAWALMIFVRVRYKKSTFGKVLMWLYISLIIFAIICFIAVVAACGYIVKTCPQ